MMIRLRSIVSDIDFLPKLVSGCVLVVSVMLVLLGMMRPWFAVPLVVDGDVVTRDSGLTVYFKVLLFIVFLFLLIGSKGRRDRLGRRLAYSALVGVLVSLWFPSWLTMRDADLMGDAAWLQQQHDNMTWLGGDVYRAHSERSSGWGSGVNAQDPPSRLAVYKPPVGSLSAERMNDWIWWLGYGPAFTQFVGKGWFYTVFGCFFGLVCIIGYYWRKCIYEARVLLRKLFSRGVALGAVMLLVSVMMVIMTSRSLNLAKGCLSDGDYVGASEGLRSALVWMPSLECDSGVLRQMGYLDIRNGEVGSDYAALYEINSLEEEGYYAQSRDLLEKQIVLIDEKGVACARELLRHQIRVAVNEINSGRYEQAGRRLDQVIEGAPFVIQARFHRQLVALHTGEVERGREMNRSLLEIYDRFKSKNKRGVIAASWLMLAQSELDAGNVRAAGDARQKSKGVK